MIRNIFIPEAYNGYYILPTKIVGIHVSDHALYATVMHASGWDRSIREHIYEPIVDDTTTSFEQRMDTAVQNIAQRLPRHDRVYVALPSKDCIYKELTLPFTDIKKIEDVAPFEIENSLPFSLEEAIVSSVVTRQEAEQTTVLTTVIRQQTLETYLAPFETHNLSPDGLTYDAIAQYTNLHYIPEFRQHNEVVAYLDIDIGSSRIFVLEHGSLRLMRTISHGVQDICGLNYDTYQQLKQGLQACDVSSTSAQKSQLHSDLQFTLAAANKILGPQTNITKIMITGMAAHIPDITHALSTIGTVSPEVMNANIPLHMDHVTTQTNSHIPSMFMTSVATALPAPIKNAFWIRRSTVSEKERTARTYQIGTAASLIVLFFISFFAYSMYRTYTLQNEVSERHQELATQLRKTFNITAKGKQAEPGQLLKTKIPQQVSKEENIWFSLSQQQTFSFLYYLQELNTHIDRTQLGLVIRKLTIQKDAKQNQDTIKIEGEVQDYNALRSFEDALRETKLFSLVPRLQETKFDLLLPVAPTAGRAI